MFMMMQQQAQGGTDAAGLGTDSGADATARAIPAVSGNITNADAAIPVTNAELTSCYVILSQHDRKGFSEVGLILN